MAEQIINKAATSSESIGDALPQEWHSDSDQEEAGAFGPAVTPKSKDAEPYSIAPLSKGEGAKFVKQFQAAAADDHI